MFQTIRADNCQKILIKPNGLFNKEFQNIKCFTQIYHLENLITMKKYQMKHFLYNALITPVIIMQVYECKIKK